MDAARDTAIVLSGGGVSGLMLELGFLKRLRESEIWPRVGYIYGTSAGAMAGAMACLDRLDDLERFLLELQPEDTFRPNPLWRLPLLGSHIYSLPETVERRLGPLDEIGAALTQAECELTVIVTDVSPNVHHGEMAARLCEQAYAARSTTPEEMVQALFASAAISVMVSPRRVGARVATDGSWVRNFPLAYAYQNPQVDLIASFQYESAALHFSSERLDRYAGHLRHLRRLKPVRAVRNELQQALERAAEGEPLHAVEAFVRLMQIAILRNTALEEMQAREKDLALTELETLQLNVLAAIRTSGVRGRKRQQLERAIGEAFAAAQFPFRHDRCVPRIAVSGSANGEQLESGFAFRQQTPWAEDAKRRLIERGYQLCDEKLSLQAQAA